MDEDQSGTGANASGRHCDSCDAPTEGSRYCDTCKKQAKENRGVSRPLTWNDYVAITAVGGMMLLLFGGAIWRILQLVGWIDASPSH